MYKSIVCFLAYLCKFNYKDSLRYGQKSSTPLLFNFKIRQKFLPCDRDRSRMAETVALFKIARRWNDFLECPQGTARSTAFARAKSFHRIAQKILVSNHPRNINRKSVAVWKFLTAYVECIERICAVGAVFEQVFFRLGKFFAGFVFAETVATSAYSG